MLKGMRLFALSSEKVMNNSQDLGIANRFRKPKANIIPFCCIERSSGNNCCGQKG
jgi:hypothetical protein